MKHIIEKAVKQHGVEKVKTALLTLGLAKESVAADKCDPGYVWDNVVKMCVLDGVGG